MLHILILLMRGLCPPAWPLGKWASREKTQHYSAVCYIAQRACRGMAGLACRGWQDPVTRSQAKTLKVSTGGFSAKRLGTPLPIALFKFLTLSHAAPGLRRRPPGLKPSYSTVPAHSKLAVRLLSCSSCSCTARVIAMRPSLFFSLDVGASASPGVR